MYLPDHFKVEDRGRLFDVIRRYPLALLTTSGPSGLTANAVPMLLDESANVLRTHVARANPVWGELEAGAECLVVFQATDHYVSPSWYPSKAETHKVVPTWNYAMVQVRGAARTIHDPQWLRGLVGKLTDVHEKGRPQPWSVDDAPVDFIEAQLRGIVGIEIAIDRIDGKFKASQNRNAADREGVAAQLRAQGGAAAHESAALVQNPGGKD